MSASWSRSARSRSASASPEPLLPGSGREAIGAAPASFEKMARTDIQEDTMGKTGRKRRARKKKGANHGKRPNT